MGSEKAIIRLVLAVGLIHGLLFVFITPPWEHYDEPAHFEYAWLIANRLKLPNPGDYDVNMRLAMGKSLTQSNFFASRHYAPPNLTDPAQPLWAGITQLTDPPLYYIYTALPLFILREAPIDTQLYAGRIFSILFLLLTLWSAYQIMVELTPPKSYLRWLVPLFMALMPGYVEYMTSVSDIVAGIGLASVWLLVAVKLLRQGPSLEYLAYITLVDIGCFYTQKIAWIALLLTPLVLFLSLFRKIKPWLGWLVTGVALLGTFLFLVRWNDSALWLRANYQDQTTHVQTGLKPPLNMALSVKLYPDNNWGQLDSSWNAGFLQLLPENITQSLRGKTVTIGSWIWADQDVTIYGPGVNALNQFDDRWFGFPKVKVGKSPVFVSSTFQLPEDEDRLQIWLRATTPDKVEGTIYFSGVVMVKGQQPADTVPQFTSADGAKGIWGGQPFINMVRNGFMQATWPFPIPKAIKYLQKGLSGLNPTHISSVIALALDWKGTSWYTVTTSSVIFRTFWAKFSWGQVPLYSLPALLHHPYSILLGFTLFALIGGILGIFIWPKKIPWNEVLFLVIFIISVIAIAYFYGVYIMGGGLRFRTFYPVARYIYPAIFPIAAILVGGWSTWYEILRHRIKISPFLAISAFLSIMVMLDIYSFFSIIAFYKV